jgi:hypothetical protein
MPADRRPRGGVLISITSEPSDDVDATDDETVDDE